LRIDRWIEKEEDSQKQGMKSGGGRGWLETGVASMKGRVRNSRNLQEVSENTSWGRKIGLLKYLQEDQRDRKERGGDY